MEIINKIYNFLIKLYIKFNIYKTLGYIKSIGYLKDQSRIHTIELFNVIITRKCIDVNNRYKKIGHILGDPNFIFNRLKAETRSKIKTFDEIYNTYKIITGITDNECENIKQLELDMECKELFIINNVYNNLDPDDIIVTDTYYNESQLKFILDKIGFRKSNTIYISYNDKYTGKFWEIFRNNNINVQSHTGCNLYSDIQLPSRNNIHTIYINEYELNDLEKLCKKYELHNLCQSIRYCRLINPYIKYSDNWNLWNEQQKIFCLLYCHCIFSNKDSNFNNDLNYLTISNSIDLDNLEEYTRKIFNKLFKQEKKENNNEIDNYIFTKLNTNINKKKLILINKCMNVMIDNINEYTSNLPMDTITELFDKLKILI